MHHHEPECHAKRLVCYFQGQGHSKRSYDHDSFCYIFWTADPFVIKLGLIVHYHKPVCIMMESDCCLCGLKLFTPGNGSRKQNIFSSNYTHSSQINRFGCALFNMRDPIPIFDALMVLSLFPIWRHESGLSIPMFLQLKIRQFRRKLVH